MCAPIEHTMHAEHPRGTSWARAFARFVAGAGMCVAAHGAIVCEPPDTRGAQACRAALPENMVRHMAVVQERSNWCWAAAMQMVLGRYGLRAAQSDIVAARFGAPANRRLQSADIASAVERVWLDAEGERFRVQAVAQSRVPQGSLPLSAQVVLKALAGDHPLLLAANGHVVVVVEVKFTRYRDTHFVRITGGTVVDPRSDIGLRPLDRNEMEAEYLAWLDVAPMADAAPAVALGD